MEDRELKRISLMIGEDQYQELVKRGLTVSWLIRDLIDDYLSANKLTLRVSDETRKLFEKIVSTANTEDEEFEPYLKDSLQNFLKQKIVDMQRLQKNLNKRD